MAVGIRQARVYDSATTICAKALSLRTALFWVITARSVVVISCHYSLRNQEQRNSQLLRGGSLKACIHHMHYGDCVGS